MDSGPEPGPDEERGWDRAVKFVGYVSLATVLAALWALAAWLMRGFW